MDKSSPASSLIVRQKGLPSVVEKGLAELAVCCCMLLGVILGSGRDVKICCCKQVEPRGTRQTNMGHARALIFGGI